MKICLVILLGISTLSLSDNLMERAYGEALLNTLSPELRAKLEEIHNDENLQRKSENEMVRIIKSRLTPEEVKELETAYRKLILPMLQSTLERQFGQKIPMKDIPIDTVDFNEDEEDDYQEESDEVVDEDFLDSSERDAKKNQPKTSEKIVKEEL